MQMMFSAYLVMSEPAALIGLLDRDQESGPQLNAAFYFIFLGLCELGSCGGKNDSSQHIKGSEAIIKMLP